MKKKMRLIPLFYALFLIGGDCLGIGETADNHARILKAASSDPVPLNVYNWEDYIQDDEDLNGDNVIQDDEKGLITLFEEKMLEEGINVQVNYSAFDTNETMLAEMKTGKAHYDLVCPSDYVIQKMIADDLIQPFDEGSTPNYDRYVSPFVKEKIGEIEVEGHEKGVVNDYARGYMWGTLGLLYNPGFSGVLERGISEDEMRQDLSDWTNLWDKKYKNLLAIKDSMRDTYAVGIMKTYDQDFELDGESHEGFSTLKRKYEEGLYDDEEYNAKVSEIFNLHDDDTLARVGRDLQALKENAFGFEVDSGKVDMARGMYFAINVAWSGDAAYAMDMADENNEAHEGENGFTPTILKYLLPDTGANIWFDGWVIPKDAQHKDLAQKFVDFLSMPENAAVNMNYIGYTPVIAGDDILDLVLSWYDIRYNEDTGLVDPSYLEGLTEVAPEAVYGLSDEEIENSYYRKDIAYFFDGTLESFSLEDAVFCLSASEKDRQFDTQYPDASVLPGLAVMADFGPQQNAALLMMWENVKNTNLPLWAYILILLAAFALIALAVALKIRRKQVLRRRKERKEGRLHKDERSKALLALLTEGL